MSPVYWQAAVRSCDCGETLTVDNEDGMCTKCQQEFTTLSDYYRPRSKASRYDAEGLRMRTTERGK